VLGDRGDRALGHWPHPVSFAQPAPSAGFPFCTMAEKLAGPLARGDGGDPRKGANWQGADRPRPACRFYSWRWLQGLENLRAVFGAPPPGLANRAILRPWREGHNLPSPWPPLYLKGHKLWRVRLLINSFPPRFGLGFKLGALALF